MPVTWNAENDRKLLMFILTKSTLKPTDFTPILEMFGEDTTSRAVQTRIGRLKEEANKIFANIESGNIPRAKGGKSTAAKKTSAAGKKRAAKQEFEDESDDGPAPAVKAVKAPAKKRARTVKSNTGTQTDADEAGEVETGLLTHAETQEADLDFLVDDDLGGPTSMSLETDF